MTLIEAYQCYCSICHVEVTMTERMFLHLKREDQDYYWYCLNGHKQHFKKPTVIPPKIALSQKDEERSLERKEKPEQKIKQKSHPMSFKMHSKFDLILDLLQKNEDMTFIQCFRKIYGEKTVPNLFYRSNFKKYCDGKGVIADNYMWRGKPFKRQVDTKEIGIVKPKEDEDGKMP